MHNLLNIAPRSFPNNSNEPRRPRSRKISSTKGDAKGKYKMVSYCPECPTVMADPEQSPHATVNPKTKQASCRSGHRWRVR